MDKTIKITGVGRISKAPDLTVVSLHVTKTMPTYAALMDKNIDIMCVSEFGTHKNENVGEYSISHGEPCFETIKFLKHARKLGHKVWAKIQVNNCWEMSSVPTLPCFELIINHLTKLKKLGVNDIMLSWTLGGFPSFNISLTNSVLSKDFNYNLWLKEEFEDNAIYIKMVSHLLSEGFKKFPFNLHLLYFSPLSLGPANMIYSEPTGKKATIVTFPYDDGSSMESKKVVYGCTSKGLS